MNTPIHLQAIRAAQDTVHYQHITVQVGSPTKRVCPLCLQAFVVGVRMWKDAPPYEETELCLLCWDTVEHALANPKEKHPPRTLK